MYPTTTFDDFVEIVQNVEICGDLSDAEIAGDVRSFSEEEDDDDKCEPPPTITFKEAVISIKTVRAFIESDTFPAVTHLQNIIDSERKRNTHQIVLEKYFK